MIEKINPTIPIPIETSSISDEQREVTIAKSNIAIPNPIFSIVNPPSQILIVVSFPLLFPLYYIFPFPQSVMNPDKGKYEENKLYNKLYHNTYWI